MLFTPFRERIEIESNVSSGGSVTIPTDSISTVPVRYNNRAADATGARTQSIAGWYYIAVQVGPVAENPASAAPVPVRLEVSVTGTAEPGPRYDPASDAAQAGLFGENRPPKAAASQEPIAAPGTAAPGSATTRSAISTAGGVAIAVGAVLVVALGGGWLALRRRRATRYPSARRPPRAR
jgi:Ca-activated chloride channel family protein